MLRRDLLLGTSLIASSLIAPFPLVTRASATSDLDAMILRVMHEDHIPGVAACIVDKDEMLWSNAYGWSNIEANVPMGLDSIQNIGSISKTFVATAIMQLAELGLLELDRDINDYLSFPIRNPNYPDVPISTRQLMTHLSSLRDGSAYANHYACGDPKISLGTWIEAFFTPGGAFYKADENFNPWPPGAKWQYANLPYGVLGHLVESVAGIPFELYCRRNIFAPLGMQSTGWMISDIDRSRHTVPYSWVENGVVRGPSWGEVAMGVVRPDGLTLDRKLEDGYQPNCFYNHPNYPDGFLRTTVSDLSRYLRAYLNMGLFDGSRILNEQTVQAMFTPQVLPPEEQGKRTYGLTWYALEEFNNQHVWEHGGGDPGIGTGLYMLRDNGVGAIVFTNTIMSRAPKNLTRGLLQTALSLVQKA